jgi:hypothetical protein
MPPTTIAAPNATSWLKASERLYDLAHGAQDGAGRENRQTVAADQAQR